MPVKPLLITCLTVSLFSAGLISCNNGEERLLMAQQKEQEAEILALEFKLSAIKTEIETRKIDDPTQEIEKLQIEVEAADAEIESLQDDVEGLEADKKKLEEEFVAYKKKYPIRAK